MKFKFRSVVKKFYKGTVQNIENNQHWMWYLCVMMEKEMVDFTPPKLNIHIH